MFYSVYQHLRDNGCSPGLHGTAETIPVGRGVERNLGSCRTKSRNKYKRTRSRTWFIWIFSVLFCSCWMCDPIAKSIDKYHVRIFFVSINKWHYSREKNAKTIRHLQSMAGHCMVMLNRIRQAFESCQVVFYFTF